jgi:hypothetical protein
MNKKLSVSIPVLIVIIISVIVTTVIMNNKEPIQNPNLSPETNQQSDNKEEKVDKIYININRQKLEVDLENNSTVSALTKMLPLELSMNDLNNNEKYAYLDNSLPTNTYSPKHIEAGDVMLFGDNCLVIFYESFDTSYSYSKIGHINNLPELDDGNVSVNLSTE